MARDPQTHAVRGALERQQPRDGGAARVYFFALFPTLLFLVALASYFPVVTLIDDLFRTMGGFMPPEALQLITDQMAKISDSEDAGLMTLGMLLAVSSSSPR